MNDHADKTMPCQFCGTQIRRTAASTRLCDGCWEVDRRVDSFVRTPAGRARVLEALLEQERLDQERRER